MKLELKKQGFDSYECGAELTLTQEESAETIVPDYCPDIARIIETSGRIYLHNRELREGKAEITGSLRVHVLYTAEGESGIRSLVFSIPFSVEGEGAALSECCYLMAETETEYLESRMLNPRKIFTHCKLVTRLRAYKRVPLEFCTDVEASPELSLQKRRERQHAVFLTGIAEKDFTFSDEMELSSGKEGAAELLSSEFSGTVTEAKVLGNKLVFKGMFHLSVLYRTQEGGCDISSSELPFSQIMELEGVGEGAEPSVELQLTGCELQLDGGDEEGRRIGVTLYVHATALLREERELNLLSDLYSTSYQCNFAASPLPLTCYRETMLRRQNIRETLEIGVVAESILAMQVHFGAVSVSREGTHATLRCGASVKAMYQDEGGATLVAERCIDVTSALELEEDCKLKAKAVCPGDIQSGFTERGIEVRFPVEFQIEAVRTVKRICIDSVELDEDAPKDTANAPSLVLRCLGAQESAWDLAKRYHTTIETILSANQMEKEEELPREKLLLIPRKRA